MSKPYHHLLCNIHRPNLKQRNQNSYDDCQKWRRSSLNCYELLESQESHDRLGLIERLGGVRTAGVDVEERITVVDGGSGCEGGCQRERLELINEMREGGWEQRDEERRLKRKEKSVVRD
uniref:Uncharacterized protein n=1 Tax=Fagus sylvatica TaxID=28930 RepID=A0A2N9H5C9_FAGSY